MGARLEVSADVEGDQLGVVAGRFQPPSPDRRGVGGLARPNCQTPCRYPYRSTIVDRARRHRSGARACRRRITRATRGYFRDTRDRSRRACRPRVHLSVERPIMRIAIEGVPASEPIRPAASPPIVDGPFAPEIFATGFAGPANLSGVTVLTRESARCDYTRQPPGFDRVAYGPPATACRSIAAPSAARPASSTATRLWRSLI